MKQFSCFLTERMESADGYWRRRFIIELESNLESFLDNPPKPQSDSEYWRNTDIESTPEYRQTVRTAKQLLLHLRKLSGIIETTD